MNPDEKNYYETLKARQSFFSQKAKMEREIDSRAGQRLQDQNPAPAPKPARLQFSTPEEAAQSIIPPSKPAEAAGADDTTMTFSIDPQSVQVERSGTGREIVLGKDHAGNQITLGYLAQNPESMRVPKPQPDPGLQNPPGNDPNTPTPPGLPSLPTVAKTVASTAGGVVKGLALGLSEAGGVVGEAAGISEEMEEFGAYVEETFGIPRTIPVNTTGTADDVGQAFGRFGAVFVPAARAAKMLGAGLFVRGMVAGAIADFSAFPAEEPNLGDIANQFKDVNPEIASGIRETLIDVLAKDFGEGGELLEGEFEARLKNSFGGVIAGGAIDSTVFMYRMARRVMAQPNNLKNLIMRGLDGERRLAELSKSRISGTGNMTSQEIATKEIKAMNDIFLGQVGAMADDLNESLAVRALKPLLNEDGAITLKSNKVIETPEFKKFFQGSKVVEKTGKPLIVFKGMPGRDIEGNLIDSIDRPGLFPPEIFNPSRRVKLAGFFTSSPDVASKFATLHRGGVFPVHLSMKNPRIIDAKGKPAGAFQFDRIGDPGDLDSFFDALGSNKFDGVIIKNTSNEGDVYIPKNTEQIRSIFQDVLTNERGEINLESIKRFESEVKKAHGLQQFGIHFDQKNNAITLDTFIVPKDMRNQGVGSKAMKKLTDLADKEGVRVFLSPGVKDDFHGTTSRARLVKFYKRFGFVENKGRNKDFSLSAGLIREPKK